MSANARLHTTSAAYRTGYSDGFADGRSEDRTQIVIIRLIDTDGRMRIAQDVLDRLHKLGWCLHKLPEAERS